MTVRERDLTVAPFTDHDLEGSLPARFERIAALGPDRLAVEGLAARFTYAELNRRANGIAVALAERYGPGRDGTRVALLFDHDAPVVAAALGVLKAGHTCVALNTTDPPGRIAHALSDSEPVAVLTDRRHVRTAHQFAPAAVDVIDIDDLPLSDAAPDIDVAPETGAMILYTSGSTGRPKGVIRSHRNLLHGAKVPFDLFRIGPDDRLCQLAPLSTGQGVTPLWSALLCGASVHPFPLKQEGVSSLARWLSDRRISFYQSSTTAYRSLLRIVRSADALRALRLVRIGGEPLFGIDVEHHRQTCPFASVLANVFSMTETGTANVFLLDHDAPVPDGPVPAGYPVPGKRVWIAGPDGEPVPEGDVGEILVRSRYLSSGYWRDPKLTAARFRPQADGSVVFHTGDRGRLRPDGCLEYVGRSDARVKIRGYRVEPAEIEGWLARHPAVRTPVVVAVAKGDDVRLAAFFTTAGEAPPHAALRAHLLNHLPDYLVPQRFTALDALPTTPTGKPDRAALVEMARHADRAGSSGPARALTTTEAEIADIWAETGIRGTAPDDDYFVAGGDSLRAAQMLARVADRFGVDVPFSVFLDQASLGALSRLVETPGGNERQAPVVRRGAAHAPLSFQQEQLWLVHQTAPSSAAYNTVRAARLTGPLNESALRQALDALVDRHASLRTVIVVENGTPMQAVEPRRAVELRLVDLSSRPADARDAELVRLVTAEAHRPFDLARDVLLRALVVRLGPEEHACVLVNHHIASDAWSGEILVRELSAFYGAFDRGETLSLDPLPAEYADFASWQREVLSESALAGSRSYWLARLAGAGGLHMPGGGGGEVPTGMGRTGRVAVRWSRELVQGLERVARGSRATVFMVFVAALLALLRRYTGQDDIVLGTPVSGRQRPELGQLVGLFANMVVLRTSLAGDPTLLELVERVRETAIGAYEHQTFPFVELIHALNPERTLGGTPLLQVVVGMTASDSDGSGLTLPGTSSRAIEVVPGAPKFDLTVSVTQRADGLSGYIEFDTRRFSAEVVQQMAGHLGRILDELIRDNDVRVSELAVLSNDERRRALTAWNETATPLPGDGCLTRVFRAQVEAHPDAVAVVDGDEALSYRELDRRAREIAVALAAGGVSPGMRVALLFERSSELVVGTLGVVAAGAVYVPLDPESPVARMSAILRDATARVVVCQASLAHIARALDAEVVCLRPGGVLDEPIEAGAAMSPSLADRAPDDPACVMYTSGSTGAPKGVVIPCRAIARLVLNTNYVHLTPDDRIGLASNVAFDAVTFEIWGAILNGASAVVLPQDVLLSVKTLGAELAARCITVLFLPTALFNHIAAHAPSALAGIGTVLVGGEAASPDAMRRVLDSGRPGRLVNVYGPTETTTFASWHMVDAVPAGAMTVPIGLPVANTELFVLDERREPVPTGVVGEIVIGGAGVGLGYIGRPELTGERFVPHPVRPDDRVYRTGDLGWRRSDGVIVFLGRLDDQVKIRGFRVEPAEVEVVLARHPDMAGCAVVARSSDHGERVLVGYVVPRTSRVTPSALSAFLATELPGFMVPTAIVVLPALPLTPSGKVDRDRLPEPPKATSTREWEAPVGNLEDQIARIWREVLGAARVGRHDNFFEIGGHSLLVVRAVALIERALERPVPAHLLFAHPTIVGLSAALEEDGAAAVPPRIGRSRERPLVLPASEVQRDAWERRELRPPAQGYMVVRAFDLDGPLDVAALEGSLSAVVVRHEVLRTALLSLEGQLTQRILPAYCVTVVEVDLESAPDAALRADAIFDDEIARPFDFEAGPWMRAVVARFSERRHRLVLSLPHIVYDAWSLDLLFREIEVIYAARRAGRVEEPSPPPLQYADVVLWQERTRTAGGDRRALEYWRERLRRVRPVPIPFRRRSILRHAIEQATRLRTLPGFDRPGAGRWLLRGAAGARALISRSREAAGPAGHVPVVIPPATVRELRTLARAEGVTLFVVGLAALKATLAALTGETDVAIATYTANRPWPELRDVMGHLGNTVAIRSDLRGDPSFRDLVRRVGTGWFADQAHGTVPFADVSRSATEAGALPLERRLPVVFQLIEGLDVRPRLADVVATPVRSGTRHLAFRIAITLAERGDGLAGSLTFDPGLYEASSCRALAGHFCRTLERVAAAPDDRLSELGGSAG